MEENTSLVYKDVPSTVGLIRLVASDTGLTAILWEGEDYKRTKLPEPVRDDTAPVLVETERQPEENFAKKRTVFDIPLDLKGTEFQVRVWEALLHIPFGATKTYGEL